jgi:hypothetical protein
MRPAALQGFRGVSLLFRGNKCQLRATDSLTITKALEKPQKARNLIVVGPDWLAEDIFGVGNWAAVSSFTGSCAVGGLTQPEQAGP